jgi:molybdopterin converting factor small subunit
MRIKVLFFGPLRDRFGDELALQLEAGQSLADLRQRLGLGEAAGSAGVAWAVNMEYVPLETVLKDGDEVALIPPVAGGRR